MFGQKKLLEYDQYQQEVDRYFSENNPYGPLKPLRINLRKYLQYAEENNITDPSMIPDDVLDQFMIPDEPQQMAQ